MDRYERIKKLGCGATADVWLAHDKLTKEAVVVKEVFKRFRSPAYQEVDVLKKLRSVEGVPYLLDSSEDDVHIHLVMEYIQGKELFDLMDSDVNVSRIFFSICKTLDEAYRKRIIHRDIKAENIIVTSDHDAYIVDWGFALDLDHPDTKGARAAGSFGYISPELILTMNHIGNEPDIWCLGVLLYAMLLRGFLPYNQSVRDVKNKKTPVVHISSVLTPELRTFMSRFFEHYTTRITLGDILHNQESIREMINKYSSKRFLNGSPRIDRLMRRKST